MPNQPQILEFHSLHMKQDRNKASHPISHSGLTYRCTHRPLLQGPASSMVEPIYTATAFTRIFNYVILNTERCTGRTLNNTHRHSWFSALALLSTVQCVDMGGQYNIRHYNKSPKQTFLFTLQTLSVLFLSL